MSKREMITSLLESYEYAIEADILEATGEHIQRWASRVSTALAQAGMLDEEEAWKNALSHTRFKASGDVEPSYALHGESMKSILLGILTRIEMTEPGEELFSLEILAGTRNYVVKLAEQAHGCYKRGWYDACAVMIRRLVEIMIIDCFERRHLSSSIKDGNDDYFMLEKLIAAFLAETTWHIPRPVKKHLPKLRDLKEIGDSGAHGRNIVSKARIDKLSEAIDYTFQGLVEIAYLQPYP